MSAAEYDDLCPRIGDEEKRGMYVFRLLVRYPWALERCGLLEGEAGDVKRFGNMVTYSKNLRPEPRIFQHNQKVLIILGSPICGERIEIDQVANRLLYSDITDSCIAGINGSFLFVIYDERDEELTIINDRFASVPFYYWLSDREFIGSIHYTDIWREVRGRPGFSIAEESFYEFIHFQRLLGDKTYDKCTKYLNSASILKYSLRGGDLRIARYWRPDFGKDGHSSRKDFSHALAAAVRQSVRARTSDSKRYGLLLSGGLDSRTVLAASEVPLTCFTVGEFKNNEVRVAALLASAKRYPHVFIPRSPDHYAQIVEDAVMLGSGMNVYDHAHFLNLGDDISNQVDVIFHGHGFDYFFQGLYLPKETINLWGRPTYIQRLKDIKGRICEEYIASVKYRLKCIDSIAIVKQEYENRMREALRASVEHILNDGKAFYQDEYDLWEYMHVHNLSRHYTNLNVLSICSFIEERTLCFDNHIFDLYLKMPVRFRMSGEVLRQTIQILNKDLADIVNANVNLPARYGPYEATMITYGNRLLKRLRLKRSIPTPPRPEERSWPNREKMVRECASLRAQVLELKRSDRLASLEFLDMDKVSGYVDIHMNNEGNYGPLLLTLLTIDRFLDVN